MKYWIVAFLMPAISSPVAAQNEKVFEWVDSKATRFPMYVTQSSFNLAVYIQAQFTSNKDRIRAAYRWVTANIEYDKDSMLTINWSNTYEDKIAATLRRKKGVCDNFASVFTDVLLKMNIPSYVVHGITRGEGTNASQAHSWSSVYEGNKWLLCDPTWDAAFSNQPNFYLLAPAAFIQTHWPFDPLWQLLAHPIKKKEFDNGFTLADKNNNYVNVEDSVKTYLALDSLQQLEAISRRMKLAGLDQEALRLWYAYNQMNIAIINGENDMYIYNAAVADLNNASASLNTFIRYRNNFFKPLKPDPVISEMLQPVNVYINAAYKKADSTGLAKENVQYDTGSLKDRLKALSARLEEQKQFLNRYLAAPPAEREKLFYK